MTFSKTLVVEFSANALLGHAKQATEEVEDRIDECLKAAGLTLAVVNLGVNFGTGFIATGNFNLS